MPGEARGMPATRETRKVRRLKTPDGKVEREVIYRDWQVKGRVDDQESVEIVVNDTGSSSLGSAAVRSSRRIC